MSAFIEIEAKKPTDALLALKSSIELIGPRTRAGAARIVNLHGYGCHVGGRHVAVLERTERVAIITASYEDWK